MADISSITLPGGGTYDLKDKNAAKTAQLGYPETGTTASRNYSAGEYICWRGLLHTANQAISSGTTLNAGTGGNLSECPGGGFNSIRIKTGTKSGTTNANGLLALDEDPTTTIVLSARLLYHNDHTICLIDFYKYQSDQLWIVKVLNGSAMAALGNESVTVEYYYITR